MWNKTLLLILLSIAYPAFGLTVSVNSVCSDTSQSYNFNSYDYNPDFKILISSYATSPDYSFKIVSDKNVADIVIEDNTDGGFSICKSIYGKTIKIQNYGYDPDIIINISDFNNNADWTIYHNSKILSVKEAISILVVPSFSILDKSP